MDIENTVNKYSSELYKLMFGNQEDKYDGWYEKGRSFLLNYSISEVSEFKKCAVSMQKVFRLTASQSFELLTMDIKQLLRSELLHFTYISSPLFSEADFHLMQSIGKHFGDTLLYVVEYEGCEDCADMAFKLKFPIDISWEEFTSGGCISFALTRVFYNRYYVFGNSGKWGKWCDYDNQWSDYELFAYNEDCDEVRAYRRHFSMSHDSLKEINDKIGIPSSLAESIHNGIII